MAAIALWNPTLLIFFWLFAKVFILLQAVYVGFTNRVTSETVNLRMQMRNNEVWSKFWSQRWTYPTDRRDYDEWHRGREKYAIWTIFMHNRSIQARFDAARAHLAEFLWEPYRRQAHVTLFVCGFMAVQKRFQDDYSDDECTQSFYKLKKARFEPFEIEIGGINSFASAPFLEVFDVSNRIERIRNVISGGRTEIREEAYVPHITLGLYKGRFETKRVAESISSFPKALPIIYLVDKIILATYASREIAGPLSMKGAIDLREGKVR